MTETAGTNRPLLQLEGLRTYFSSEEGVAKAVDGVDLEVREGETLGLVGESGCGKSVTALSILGLVPGPSGEIVDGRIVFRGRDLRSLSTAELRELRGNQIAMVFQEPMTALNPVFTVGEQIGEVARVHQGLDRRSARARSIELLELVGIPSPERRVDDYPHKLSGGMRQRVMIAMAMACDPALLIADEPTTALDVTVQAQILTLIRDLQERTGMSVLLITHDLGVVAEVADRVAVMYAGKVVEAAPVAELFERPFHPYTTGLLRSLPDATRPGERLPTLPGSVPNPLHFPSGCRYRSRCSIVQERCAEEPALTPVPDHAERRSACHFLEEAGRL